MRARIARQAWPASVLIILLVAAIPAAAAGIVVGLPPDQGTGNCFPFGCAYSGEYQQVYNSGQFSGPITITNLEFYNTQNNFGGTGMNSGNWAISLSTTSADWNSLSGSFASNIGADNTLVFNGNLAQPWAFGDSLVINLSTPFTYNPASGNLLLDIFASGVSTPGGELSFDTNGYNVGDFNGNDYLGRVYCFQCESGSVNSGYGLVTGFDGGFTSIPEPGLMGVLGLVLTGMGLAIRRRRSS